MQHLFILDLSQFWMRGGRKGDVAQRFRRGAAELDLLVSGWLGPRFGVRFSKNGSRFCAKFVPPGEKQCKFRLCPPTGEFLHADGCSMVLQRREHLFSTLQTLSTLRGETGFVRVFGPPKKEGHKFIRKMQFIFGHTNGQTQAFVKSVERKEHLECLGASVERPV